MELSNLTICRQDVIVVSDSEAKGNQDPNSNKKKKAKMKTECIRKVQLTRMTVERTVPFCDRKRCRRAQYYHRQTSKNTKYTDKGASAEKVERKSYKSENNNKSVAREIYSPITIQSSSDTYDQVSPNDFNTASTDSDELEDLIRLTRKRMKKEKDVVKHKPQTPACAIQNDDQNNVSDGSARGSIHSMDTVVLQTKDTLYSPISPYSFSDGINKEMEPTPRCPRHDDESNHSDATSLFSAKSNSLSPLYEISGKVFMEHYLNTSI